jgi:preprotein translocase subunit SecE
MAEKIKIAFAVLLVVAGIAGYYYWGQSPLIARVGSVIAGTAAGLAVFWVSAIGKQFFSYARESIDEAKRVVWPTRKETLQTTAVVFGFVLIMAIFLWLIDASLLWAVGLLMGQGGS